ncbi:MAG TPA: sulfatase-like hydrolase/transferase [Pirellulaceae bacterium]|jgi:N-acetylgalactosamine-6-sulfatase
MLKLLVTLGLDVTVVWCVNLLLLANCFGQSGVRPNIVLILADDMGYGDLGCYGCPDIRTPNIDALARQGIRLTNFYSNGPECSPTRTGLMTGRYQHRVGGLECAIGVGNVGRYDDAIRLANQHELGLPVERSVLARSLKDVGYATAICGKWHLGYEPKFLPLKHGFDYAFGPLGGNIDYFHHHEPGGTGETMLYQNDQPIKRDGYMTDLIAEEACASLKRTKQPFFLYVPFNAPHSPFQGPNDGGQPPLTSDTQIRGSRAKYVEMVERLDQCVGQILKSLDEIGAAKNTLVIFASDNGGPNFSRNDPLSGRKGTTYEGGIRVPCILRWPDALPPGRESSQVGITMDLTASILNLAGAKPLPNLPLDGMDIVGHLREGKADVPRTLFWRGRRGENTWRGVRDGNLKLVSRQDGDKRQDWIFDLASDLAEKNDLSKTRPGELDRMQALLVKWEAAVKPER